MADNEAKQTCLQCGIYFREKCVLRNQAGRPCLYHRVRARSEE